MDKRLTIFLVCVVIMGIIFFIIFSSNSQATTNSNDFSQSSVDPSVSSDNTSLQAAGGQRNYGNMTPAERQQAMQARMQSLISACQGETAGNNCTIQGRNGTITGICQVQNNTFLCVTRFGGRRRSGATPSVSG
ncbi:Uncharacterised protein [uncultured archaeon]|nr:Uncharacterised protein [uncultured archaeon]